MKNLAILGRILFALPFGLMGLNHFLMTNTFLGMMSSFVPAGAYTILLVGAMMIAASISIILNKYIRLTCFSLAGLLLIFILSIHIPGLFTDNWQLALVELLKDTSIMGGAILFGIYSETSCYKPQEQK
ncbi:MAG: hypothetical protein RIS29_160 [Bacteroidota bacterium]|jgi:uncharacterized membrane protein